MKGLDGLIYMSSTSEANGARARSRSPSTTRHQSRHRAGAGAEQAAARDAVAAAGRAAAGRQRHQVAQPASCMVVGFVSEDGSMGRSDIADYVIANLVDPLSRVPGVGSVQVFGAPYAMRIWLDPNKLDDVQRSHPATSSRADSGAERAGRRRPARRHAGGRRASSSTPPSPRRSRLQTPEQFRDIVVRSNPDGSVLKLGDVARVELGAETTSSSAATTASRPPASPSRSRPAPTRSTTAKGVQARARRS